MPELPEVEIVRRGLAPVFIGHKFARVEQRRPDLRFPLPKDFSKQLRGKSVERLERRAKYLLAHLSDGQVLLMHLGMTGRFTIHKELGTSAGLRIGSFIRETAANSKHDHVVFHFDQGCVVTYNDPRRFGFMLLIAGKELPTHPLMCGLGVEPLGPDLTAAHLARRAAGKAVDLKAFLLDQRIVAGLGNIYVCEALFRAGISPMRQAATLAGRSGAPTQRCVRMAEAIRGVLKASIAAGGSSLRDYRHADGALGAFQQEFAVYGRDREPCVHPRCRGVVQRVVQSGRSTFYCSKCQR